MKDWGESTVRILALFEQTVQCNMAWLGYKSKPGLAYDASVKVLWGSGGDS